METKLNTPLTSEEIDFRIQSINTGGYATILAYKDARVDMKRLDDVFGVEYWQKKFEVINGNLFCSVGIFNEKLNQWIWKQDVGTESMTEKEKGQASDAFKRACFNLGIGRELYDYPIISIKLNPTEFKLEEYNGKKVAKQTYELKLKSWTWESFFNEKNVLIKLQAKDNNNTIRFAWNKGQAEPKQETKKVEKPYLNENSTEFLKAKEYIEGGGSLDAIEKKYMLSETVKLLLTGNKN